MKIQALKRLLNDPQIPQLPRHRDKEHFVKGPIPMSWISAACLASGRGSGFLVAIALWYLAGLNGGNPDVILTSQVARLFHLNRFSVYRGLKTLVKARLVDVHQQPGQAPRVRILPVLRED